ncbi:MAG: putative class III extradiol MEMO1 family dioxygenase [Lentisphaeria bacterium]|jgi:predicted class III extradiol MEMO1 family dioxygenase
MSEVDGGFVLIAPATLLEKFYEEASEISWETIKEFYEYSCPGKKFEDVNEYVASLENKAFVTEGEILPVGRAIHTSGVIWMDILDSIIEFGDPSRIELYGALHGDYGDTNVYVLNNRDKYTETGSVEGDEEACEAMINRWESKLPKKIKQLNHSIFSRE